MSVEVLISPRISFSHDLRETESSVPTETYPYSNPSLNTGFDFDFAFIVDTHGALIRESSTADELFSDGMLLPNSVKEITQSISPVLDCEKKMVKSLKEYLKDSIEEDGGAKYGRSNSLNLPSKLRLLSRSKSTGFGIVSLSAKPVKEEDEEDETKRMEAGKSSFWKVRKTNNLIESLRVILLRSNSSREGENTKEKRFGITRSCSLNCNGQSRSGGLIMGRSKSTGSASNLKQIGINNGKKELQKQSSAKYPPSLKKEKGQGRRSFKDYYGGCNKSERVNSVLNLPSPYISRISVDFLGFGSLFCNSSKSRKVKK